jgi:hypothetical protein
MLTKHLLTLAACTLIVACGGAGGTTSTGSGGSTGSTSSTSTGTGGAGTTSTGSGGSTGSTSTGSGGAGTTSTTGSGGDASYSAKLTGSQMYVDCQPIIKADPVHAQFDVTYANLSGSALSVKVASAVVTFGAGADAVPWPFEVTPAASPVLQPGETIPYGHNKNIIQGAPPTGSPCEHCNDTWTLSVTWEVDGQMVSDALPPTPVSCTF